MAKPYKRRDSKFYWISPTVNKVQVPQSSGTTDYDEALRMLRIKEGKAAGNPNITPSTDRGSFAAILELVVVDYEVKKRDSIGDCERRIDLHISPALGHMPAGKVSASLISTYILSRQKEGASNASINRELAIIKRAFRLGLWNGDVSAIPRIEMLPEDNARQGFFREDHFRDVLKHANPMLKDVLIVAYYTGWRIDSILHLEWSSVDLDGGVIRLRANQTKNRKAVTFPLQPFPELREVFGRRQQSTRAIESSAPDAAMKHPPVTAGRTDILSILSPWVFSRGAQRCISIRKAWEIARAKAHVPGRLIHDLRRTAVRNLLAMGFPLHMVKGMCGFKTDSMVNRYSIVTEQDILERGKVMAQKAR